MAVETFDLLNAAPIAAGFVASIVRAFEEAGPHGDHLYSMVGLLLALITAGLVNPPNPYLAIMVSIIINSLAFTVIELARQKSL